jgi:hypothetical protein
MTVQHLESLYPDLAEWRSHCEQLRQTLPLELPANNLAALIIKVIFCIVVLLATLKVNSKKSLLKSCGSIALIYRLIVPTIHWPWYTSLPIALMALSPYGTFQLMIFVLTLGSCAIAPLAVIKDNGFMTWRVLALMTSLVVLLQLSIFLFATFRQFSKTKFIITVTDRQKELKAYTNIMNSSNCSLEACASS